VNDNFHGRAAREKLSDERTGGTAIEQLNPVDKSPLPILQRRCFGGSLQWWPSAKT
jgi:hypothetical protein